MTETFRNDLLLRALRGEATERPPVWLMRQAGRTDPRYIRLKEESGLTLEALFRSPEYAAEISILPQRLGVDAIIYFQDILTPLGPMGSEFVFRPGPVTDAPVRTEEDVKRLELFDVAKELPFIGETFRRIYEALDGELPVLGFAGAPLTLAVFLIEGKTFGSSADTALNFLREKPKAAHALLEKLTRMTIAYLRYQIDAGAAAVQLFESAAFLLDGDQYQEFALPYQRRVFEAIKGTAPTIIFAREWDRVEDLDASGADVLSLPSSVTIQEARERVGRDRIIQGNLDNHLLAEGTLEDIEAATRACVDSGGRKGHIFNLSHGLLRETPYENVQHVVRVVREYV